jgi:hypothetical protein
MLNWEVKQAIVVYLKVIIPEFTWRDLGEPRKPLGAIVGVLSQDSNRAFPSYKSEALPIKMDLRN